MLPFHPPRGEENLRVDIDDIITTCMRENQEFQAKQALLRWRRVHTRATIDNLTKTLMYMRRRDIVEKINDVLQYQLIFFFSLIFMHILFRNSF
jgi:hypothetical protein